MSATDHIAVPGVPALHPLPDATISGTEHRLAVDLDTTAGARLRLEFAPIQAVRITTQDLFTGGYERGAVVEVADSLWLATLTADLAANDRFATFMDNARHFLVPAGDAVIEVAAWQLQWDGGQYPG
jgi:hypothetical protein